jgi:hypothetical protein
MVWRTSGALTENSCHLLGELVGRSANVAENESQRTPSLCILVSPCSLGGLEPDGHICLLVSSVSVDFYIVAWFSFLSIQWDPWPVFYRMDPQEGK